jgi:hypothetical protein
MSAKLFASQLKAVIEDIRLKGNSSIYCDNLIAFLKEVENTQKEEPSPVDMERYKADLSNWIAANHHEHESRLEMFRSVITAGQNSIKSSFLLNGGAAIALLAFIGHLAEIKSTHVSGLIWGLVLFSLGVLATAVTSGLTYLCQWFGASNCPRPARIFNIIAIFFGAVPYGLFLWGLYAAQNALRSL